MNAYWGLNSLFLTFSSSSHHLALLATEIVFVSLSPSTVLPAIPLLIFEQGEVIGGLRHVHTCLPSTAWLVS